MMRRIVSLLRSKKIPLLLAVVLFGIVGSYIILRSQAATPTSSFEAESSTVTSPAQKTTDTTASGSGAIQFSQAPPSDTVLVNTNFDNLPVSSPMSLANFRTAMGDPVVNGNLAVTSIRSEAGRGNYMRVTLPADQIGGGSGMASTPALKQAVDEASIEYDVRFAGAFDWSLGGKLPGLGGAIPGTSPGVAAGCAAGTGSAWSGRSMWGSGGKWNGYMYNVYKVAACGDSISTGKLFTANQWHKVKQYYKMNTVRADGTVNADGIHRMWFDGVLVIDRNNFRYRDSTSLHVTHMFWAIFRGGSEPEWASPAPGPVDFDNLVIKSPGV